MKAGACPSLFTSYSHTPPLPIDPSYGLLSTRPPANASKTGIVCLGIFHPLWTVASGEAIAVIRVLSDFRYAQSSQFIVAVWSSPLLINRHDQICDLLSMLQNIEVALPNWVNELIRSSNTWASSSELWIGPQGKGGWGRVVHPTVLGERIAYRERGQITSISPLASVFQNWPESQWST